MVSNYVFDIFTSIDYKKCYEEKALLLRVALFLSNFRELKMFLYRIKELMSDFVSLALLWRCHDNHYCGFWTLLSSAILILSAFILASCTAPFSFAFFFLRSMSLVCFALFLVFLGVPAFAMGK
ncbi:MAG: hypothetical protein ACI81G_000894 [Gammaproteobacteria bacterium]|jgi:hypothetical protein